MAQCCAAPPAIARRRLHAPAHALLPRHKTARVYTTRCGTSREPAATLLIHNYVAVLEDLSEDATTVETELFPLEALDFYTRWNLEENVSDEEIATLKTAESGGAEGDYRYGMRRKMTTRRLPAHAEKLEAGLDPDPLHR